VILKHWSWNIQTRQQHVHPEDKTALSYPQELTPHVYNIFNMVSSTKPKQKQKIG
jgi:hypothetical protein